MKKLRSLGSALCIILATVLVPVSVIASWAKAQLVDEAAFVATFAPLASEPAVQAEIERQTIDLIESQVDIEGLTADVFGGIAALGLPDRAAAALSLLEQPAAAGLRSMMNNAVGEFVRSEIFTSAWLASLQVSHRALVATATQDSLARGTVTLDSQGEMAVQLGPIIEQVKVALADSGFGLASAIPVIDASFVVAQSDALPAISLVYTLATAAGWWLPLITLALLALGLMLAHKRNVAFVGIGVGVAIASAALLVAFGIASIIVQAGAVSIGVSAAALDVIFSHTVAGMRASSWVLLVLGIILAAATVALLRFGVAERLRSTKWGDRWLPASDGDPLSREKQNIPKKQESLT